MEMDLSFSQLGHVFTRFPNPAIATIFPLMLAAILTEMIVLQARGSRYPWQNSAVSVGVAIGHTMAQALASGVILGVFAAGVYRYRLTTIDISFDHWGTLVALFVLSDFAFYWEHRCSHRARVMWASHSVHHSVDRMVLTAAGRLAWTPILSGVFLFYLPLVWIGFPPQWVFGMLSASLAYQFFVHTELVPHIRWLEWVLNTPSAHRVHHASNAVYIDKNYGGVLMIWDHLFGTYQAERPDTPVIYGLVHARSSATNPVVIAYEELWEMIKDVARAKTWRERFGRVLAPPGWAP